MLPDRGSSWGLLCGIHKKDSTAFNIYGMALSFSYDLSGFSMLQLLVGQAL